MINQNAPPIWVLTVDAESETSVVKSKAGDALTYFGSVHKMSCGLYEIYVAEKDLQSSQWQLNFDIATEILWCIATGKDHPFECECVHCTKREEAETL